MRMLRTIHFYLGCLIAPLLIFFCVSGAWQTFQLERSRKDGSYVAPPILTRLSEVHTHQRLTSGGTSVVYFRYVAAGVGLATATSTLLGVVMALQHRARRRTTWLCLIAGLVIPVALLAVFGPTAPNGP